MKWGQRFDSLQGSSVVGIAQIEKTDYVIVNINRKDCFITIQDGHLVVLDIKDFSKSKVYKYAYVPGKSCPFPDGFYLN